MDRDVNLSSIEVLKTSSNTGSRDWQSSIIDYVMYGIRPDDPKEAAAIQKKALRFQYDLEAQTLYRIMRDGVLLRYSTPKEAQEVLKETHDGTCRAHQLGPKLSDRIRRLGCYLPKMISEAIN